MKSSPQAVLRFSRKAWEKLTYMKSKSNIEISGLGITDKDNPLYVKDFELVEQESTSCSTDMDDDALHEFGDDKIYSGIPPVNFLRVWIHTHPGMSPTPSSKDEEVFNKVFGKCNWAIMFILAEDNKYTCELQYNTIPAGRFSIPIAIDPVEDNPEWDKELKEKVKEKVFVKSIKPNNNLIVKSSLIAIPKTATQKTNDPNDLDKLCDYFDWDDDLCEDCGYCDCAGYSKTYIEDEYETKIDSLFEEDYEREIQ